jgi:uroporphyrin-III C-methyltransferase / precorrin-2 dehydrogenase / sirohydrochlorin ferrochelatase
MSSRPVFPISLYVKDRPVLLVGTGDLAEERAGRLGAAGATPSRLDPAHFTADACRGVFLVLAVTGDPARDREIAAAARAAGCLAYAHDQPEISDFAMPAVARRGALSIAVSTDGIAPALARRLREELDRLLAAAGPRLDALLHELARGRATMLAEGRAATLYRLACRLRLDGAIAVDD